jgi:hypothetical protein
MMLTIFTTPQAFRGEFNLIQRNAIQSWLRLTPACEIILIGDDAGVAEAAQEFGVRHVAQIQRNEYGTPFLNSIFAAAEQLASHDLLCYINADIILTSDFARAVQRVHSLDHFLMTGQRWDLDVAEAIDFSQPDWAAHWRTAAVERGSLHYWWAADYFVYRRGLFADMPPYYLGRMRTDNWFIYNARQRAASVIDATACVVDIHQNHSYRHIRSQAGGLRKGLEERHNLGLAAEMPHVYTLLDATHYLPPGDQQIDLVPVAAPDGLVTGDQYRANIDRVFGHPAARSNAIYRQMIATSYWTELSSQSLSISFAEYRQIIEHLLGSTAPIEPARRLLIGVAYWREAEVNWREQRRPVAALLNIIRAHQLDARSYSGLRVFKLIRQFVRQAFSH